MFVNRYKKVFYLSQSKDFIYSSKSTSSKILSGFGIKMLGDGADRNNISSFLATQHIPYTTIVTMKQTHSTNITYIKELLPRGIFNVQNTDGVITTQNGIVLTTLSADCVPVMFLDNTSGIIGISHQGWKGTLDEMAGKMIHKIQDLGGRIQDTQVALGPAVGACCYEIFGERKELFEKKFKQWKKQIFVKSSGKTFLSLTRLNYLQLIDAGVKKTNIDFFPFCTSCDKRFFSRTRDGRSYGNNISWAVMI